MRDVRSDRGGYDRIIAAAVPLCRDGGHSASAQTNPATKPAELAIDAAVPMPEPAKVSPPSPSDFNSLARGLAAAKQPSPTASRRRSLPRLRLQSSPDRKSRSEIKPAGPSTAPAANDAATATPPPATATPAVEPPRPTADQHRSGRPAGRRPLCATGANLRVFDRKDERTAVETFYKARDYAPLWIENGARQRAKAASHV